MSLQSTGSGPFQFTCPAGSLAPKPTSSPYGVNGNRLSVDPHAPPYPITDATYTSINKLLGQANIGWLRIDFGWNSISAAPGIPDTTQMNWAATDMAVQNAYCSGMNILGNLAYTPSGAVTRAVQYPGERHKYLPDNMNTWAAFVRRVVTRYPQIRYWSIWNEPDINSFFRGYNSENDLVPAYNALIQYAAPGIRGNSDGQGRRYLVAPEVSDYAGLGAEVTWVRRVLAAQGQNIDAVAVHRYGYNRDASDVSSYAQSMAQQIQGTPMAAGGSWAGDVWLTEAGLAGCNDHRARDARNAIAYCTGLNYSYIDDTFQANQLIGLMQATRGASGSRWTKTFYWHSHQEVIRDSVGDNTGILAGARANSLSSRPAFTMFAGLAGPLGVSGGTYGYNQNVSVTATPSVASSYYYVWEYQWCYNGNASGDCDHLWHPYTAGQDVRTISPFVYRQDRYVYVRVRQYAWQNGPLVGVPPQWVITGEGECSSSCSGGGGGGLSAPTSAGTDSATAPHGALKDLNAERRKGRGHAGNR